MSNHSSSSNPKTALDIVADATQKILISEALILKRLGMDEVPIPINEKHSELSVKNSDDEKIQSLLQCDPCQRIDDLVKKYVEAATCATVALHQEIDRVEQNRPFGGSAMVERLIMENINLMNEIIDYDEISSKEYYSK